LFDDNQAPACQWRQDPVLPPAKLLEIGYKLALYPVMLLSSAIAAMQATLAALQPDSKTAPSPAISFTDLPSVVGSPDYWSREAKYQAKENQDAGDPSWPGLSRP
jgi:2-methylisocitrate lyase-like PEP mutase family enzyme